MLINAQGKSVVVPPKASVAVLAQLREVQTLSSTRRAPRGMFSIEQRARLK